MRNVFVAVLILAALPLVAGVSEDPLRAHFVTGEEIFINAQAIGLTDQQKSCLVNALKEVKPQYSKIEGELSKKISALSAVAMSHPVSESDVTQKIEDVTRVEAQKKVLQGRLLSRYKNCLSSEQVQKVLALRK